MTPFRTGFPRIKSRPIRNPPSRLNAFLQSLMPSHAGIKALIDRRQGQADPWLDDKYDEEPDP